MRPTDMPGGSAPFATKTGQSCDVSPPLPVHTATSTSTPAGASTVCMHSAAGRHGSIVARMLLADGPDANVAADGAAMTAMHAADPSLGRNGEWGRRGRGSGNDPAGVAGRVEAVPGSAVPADILLAERATAPPVGRYPPARVGPCRLPGGDPLHRVVGPSSEPCQWACRRDGVPGSRWP